MSPFTNYAITGAGDKLYHATRTLTAAELGALLTTPIIIVPAPGASKMLAPLFAALTYTFLSTPFQPQGASLVLQNDNGDYSYADFLATSNHLGLSTNRIAQVAPIYPTEDQAKIENVGINLASDTNLSLHGPILTSALNAQGTGYAPGDTGTIDNPFSGPLSAYEILTVGGSGVVLTYSITSPGDDYIVTAGQTTAATSGIGTGFTLDILTIRPGDGTATVDVLYAIINLT